MRQQGFTRDDTKAVKGIALVLMLFHHLAAFPDRFPVGFEGFKPLLAPSRSGGGWGIGRFALAANFCVSLYFFLGGYGLFIRWRRRELRVADSVFTLYKAYWKVFAIFIPAGYLLFSRSGEGINPLCTWFVINDAESLITTIVSNLTGWSSSLNGEWWFFGSYLCAIPMGYLFCCAIQRRQNLWVDLFLVFGIDILISGFFPSVARVEAFAPLAANVYYSRFLMITGMASTFFAGIVSAKYDLMRRLKVLLCETPLSLPLCCLGTAVLYWYRPSFPPGAWISCTVS